MKASLVLTAALAAGAHAAVIDARQRLNPRITGVPDGKGHFSIVLPRSTKTFPNFGVDWGDPR